MAAVVVAAVLVAAVTVAAVLAAPPSREVGKGARARSPGGTRPAHPAYDGAEGGPVAPAAA